MANIYFKIWAFILAITFYPNLSDATEGKLYDSLENGNMLFLDHYDINDRMIAGHRSHSSHSSHRSHSSSRSGGGGGYYTPAPSYTPSTPSYTSPKTTAPAVVAPLSLVNKDKIILAQKSMKKLGYYAGEVDGIYGKGTENAVKLFQANYKLTADGILTDTLVTHMASEALKK